MPFVGWVGAGEVLAVIFPFKVIEATAIVIIKDIIVFIEKYFGYTCSVDAGNSP